ncbi:MAG: 3'-5' exonuclease [Patescibacteria group bacterium]
MSLVNDPIYIEESQKLNNTAKLVKESKEFLEDSIKKLGAGNLETLRGLRADTETGQNFMLEMQKLHEKNASFNLPDKYKQLEELEFLAKEPYFARLDLHEDNETDSYYIGKFGLSVDNKPLITDWRAKVASIFYRYRYPQKSVKYSTPNGEVVTDLILKRTFEISEGELVKYYNNDIQLDENEIIVDKIQTRTGGVLEDIVETIQESQLDIIEADPRKLCIVQGCVGSGKSTVAIHKLSHIFFNFPNITAGRSILIAKNQILVSYLSTLFPKLGIFDISYKTISDLIVNILFKESLSIKVNSRDTTDLDAITLDTIVHLNEEISGLEELVSQKIDEVFDTDEFASFSGFIYSKENAMLENVEDAVGEMKEELELQKEYLKETDSPSRKELHKRNIAILNRIVGRLNTVGKTVNEKIFKDLLRICKINPTKELTYTQALVYIYLYDRCIGLKKFEKYQYCVVDEGQDFSILEYLVLGRLVLHGRFCILGDLNQSYQAEGLTKWEQIEQVIPAAKTAETFELDTNYRSTKPIIDLANKILNPYTQKYLPKSINRKGEEPKIIKTASEQEMLTTFKELITQDINSLDKSIGVITFSEQMFNEAAKIIKETKINDEYFIKLDSKSKIVYLPKAVYLTSFEECKGLEFSKVYGLGLDLDTVNNFMQAKKAFVVVTRAMNEVTLIA